MHFNISAHKTISYNKGCNNQSLFAFLSSLIDDVTNIFSNKNKKKSQKVIFQTVISLLKCRGKIFSLELNELQFIGE